MRWTQWDFETNLNKPRTMCYARVQATTKVSYTHCMYIYCCNNWACSVGREQTKLLCIHCHTTSIGFSTVFGQPQLLLSTTCCLLYSTVRQHCYNLLYIYTMYSNINVPWHQNHSSLHYIDECHMSILPYHISTCLAYSNESNTQCMQGKSACVRNSNT